MPLYYSLRPLSNVYQQRTISWQQSVHCCWLLIPLNRMQEFHVELRPLGSCRNTSGQTSSRFFEQRPCAIDFVTVETISAQIVQSLHIK